MQENADEFIQLAELMDARIKFAKQKAASGAKIIYRNTNQIRFNRQELVDAFYTYVSEVGLDYDDYKVLLPNSLQKVAPSSILTEKKGWKNFWKGIGVDTQLDRIATSDWLRKRVFDGLNTEAVANSWRSSSTINTIFSKIKTPSTPMETRVALSQLVADLEKSPYWKDQEPLFERQFGKLGATILEEPVVERSGGPCHSHILQLMKIIFGRKE